MSVDFHQKMHAYLRAATCLFPRQIGLKANPLIGTYLTLAYTALAAGELGRDVGIEFSLSGSTERHRLSCESTVRQLCDELTEHPIIAISQTAQAFPPYKAED